MEINKVQWRMIAKGETLPCDSFLMKKDGTMTSMVTGAGVTVGQDAYYLPVEELRSFPKEESEDERIRKELIAEIKEKIDCIPVPDCRDKEDEKALKQLNKWLAWLEKQGEQILANSAKTCKNEPVNKDFEMALAEMVDKAQKCVVEPLVVAEQWKDELIKLAKSEEPISESIDFEQELYKAFGQIKDFTLGIAIAKRFYDMGRKHKEPVSEEFEEALAKEWKDYNDRGAATVDALEDNTQELAFAKGFYRGAKWQEDKDQGAVEIAREEIYEWLNQKLSTYIDYRCRGVGESVEEFVNDLKQAMKDET